MSHSLIVKPLADAIPYLLLLCNNCTNRLTLSAPPIIPVSMTKHIVVVHYFARSPRTVHNKWRTIYSLAVITSRLWSTNLTTTHKSTLFAFTTTSTPNLLENLPSSECSIFVSPGDFNHLPGTTLQQFFPRARL